MIAPFMKLPAIVEVEETGEVQISTHPQVLYLVPNFGTKLNLLHLFMQDDELFTKTIVFVNTRHTAEKLYKSLQSKVNNPVALLNSWFFELAGFVSVGDFMQSGSARILMLAITFATDLELAMVKKIEQAIGQKIPVGELPEDLVIEKEKKKTESTEKPSPKVKGAEPAGEAFHQKKASNSKTYNFSSGKKAKMNKKKNH
jgi:superfamily II DNA/RNA helicase